MSEDEAEEKKREQQVAFEKARFEYCAKLYEREVERKETLEKKSQFLLSVVTLFLRSNVPEDGFFRESSGANCPEEHLRSSDMVNRPFDNCFGSFFADFLDCGTPVHAVT